MGTLKVVVPRDIRETRGYVIDNEGLPSGAKADFMLRLKGEIPERGGNWREYGGTKKPGDYVFSASAKLTKFGRTLTLNRYSPNRYKTIKTNFQISSYSRYIRL